MFAQITSHAFDMSLLQSSTATAQSNATRNWMAVRSFKKGVPAQQTEAVIRSSIFVEGSCHPAKCSLSVTSGIPDSHPQGLTVLNYLSFHCVLLVSIFIAPFVAVIDVAHAQALAEPAAVTTVPSSVTPRQQTWLSGSINERVLLAEELGEEGGRAFAKAKGWETLYDGKSWSMVHGPDQVYRGADDTVHLIEAKGGSGQLGKGYGHAQGTSEWAVESTKRVLRSLTATEAERRGAEAVLEAATKGTLEVHVVRTTHTLGEPHVAKLEQTVKCSEQASAMAREAASGVAKATAKTIKKVAEASDDAARMADDVTRAGDDLLRSSDDVARAAAHSSKVAPKGSPLASLGPAVVVLDGGMRVVDGIETERQFEAGEISGKERVIAHSRNAAGMAGGLSGAYVGYEAGAVGGATIGTFICPGIGTAIGGFLGGLLGGVGGYSAGDAAAAAGAEAAVEAAW